MSLLCVPYKIQRYNELKVGDFEMRQEFAAWVFRQIDNDENWLSNVLWTDDAHFSLNGEFNIQNSRYWATENPRIFTEMPLYQPRVTVLGGFTSSFIIGPFFFEKPMEELLKPFLVFPYCREKALSEITFMKVGGPPHISRGAKQLLKDTFGEIRGISRHIPVASKITRLDALRFLFMGIRHDEADSVHLSFVLCDGVNPHPSPRNSNLTPRLDVQILETVPALILLQDASQFNMIVILIQVAKPTRNAVQNHVAIFAEKLFSLSKNH
ncbi:hypothetical protein LAZ67_6001594 [Cordylochernes scorpioides]|uniref:Uncharacterized protein n=1 Tax=Cordylochernes scorpioides TaxID=51811 RepID=A0ABY6KJ82_9ARAC|nr:hypothetical protein LAZ67_6001594 [Cordylochernes scorpioides]